MSNTSNADDFNGIRDGNPADSSEPASEQSDPVHVDGTSHFEAIIGECSPVLVDFYADWCGPCKMLEPTVETIAAETAGTVAKVDIDAHRDLATKYNVQGVPTLYLFVDGEPVERLVGVQDEATLRDLVDAHA